MSKSAAVAKASYKELGQLFMVALQGERLNNDERHAIRQMQPAGVTLFSRNLRGLEQICSLVAELQTLFEKQPPIIAIDQEGGSKERLPVPPFTHWPGNPHLGRHYQTGKSDHLTRAQYQAIARELKAVGINTNFVPVIDIIDEHEPSYMQARVFGSSPNLVAQLGVAAMEATLQEGVVACAKHFPGHGRTRTDSHLKIPTIDRPLGILQHFEFVPFAAAITINCPMIMTAHILYPQVDAEQPATLSPTWLTTQLREQLGFNGIIISDDLNMMAISSQYDRLEAALLALKAGCNLLLYCDGVDHGQEVYLALQQLLQREQREHKLVTAVEESLARIETWKHYWLASPPGPNLAQARSICSDPNHRQLVAEIQKQNR